jgi:hypothetical protein
MSNRRIEKHFEIRHSEFEIRHCCFLSIAIRPLEGPATVKPPAPPALPSLLSTGETAAFAPAGAPFTLIRNQGFAPLTPGYYLPPLPGRGKVFCAIDCGESRGGFAATAVFSEPQSGESQ